MAGLGLFPVEDTSSKAMQGMGQAAQSYGAMQKQTYIPPKTAGGGLAATAGYAVSGASTGALIAGPYGAAVGGVAGAAVGLSSYLLS